MAEKKITTFTTPILVALLVVASFFVGMFWTKIRMLEGEKREKEGEIAQASPAPEAPQEAVLGEEQIAKIEVGGAAVRGEKEAPVTIIEFADYQCPFCGRYVDETYPQIWEKYGDQIYYVFRDYPLAFHQHAQKMAEVARCAGDQDQYWEMHDLIFESQEEWSEKQSIEADIDGFATQLGLDEEEFDDCLDSGKHTQAVKDGFALGQSVGVSGTPTFFINGQQLVGAQPFSAFQALIDAELAK